MTSQLRSETRFEEYDEVDRFEKITHRHDAPMPTRRATSMKRGMYRTSASRRASRHVSSRTGGIHKRRTRNFD